MFLQRLLIFHQSAFKKFTALKARLRLPEKWKGGRIEKWSLFWENLYLDYKGVVNDVIEDTKTRPLKATIISSGLCVLFAAFKTNPDAQSFHDALTNAASTLVMVGDPIRNPVAEQHIQSIQRYTNQGVLRRTDLIFFTLVWVADYSKDCNIYASQCKYLKPRYLTFYERIIDVGAFSTWWNIRRKMQDFDINNSEWQEDT